MPWVCLERCGDNIANDLAELKAHAENLTAVSFEAYDLGSDGSLVNNHFTNIASTLHGLKLGAIPMVTTVDIESIRTLVAKPQPFVDALIADAKMYGYSGYNLDFEPCQEVRDCTTEDATAYAAFLNHAAASLHSAPGGPYTLSVDVASWSVFWDWDAIAATDIDRVMVMDTYATLWNDFIAGLNKSVATFAKQQLGVGLCNTCAKQPLSQSDVAARFKAIDAAGVQEVDLWDWPVRTGQEFWWDYLGAFRHN